MAKMGRMQVTLPDLPPEEQTPRVEAWRDIGRLVLDRVAEREAANQQWRDEIAVRKGQKPRPQLRPSILPLPPQTATDTGRRRRGKPTHPQNAELPIHRAVPLPPATLPVGATCKGFEPYVVQELLIHNENTRYLRARYELPEGGSVLAPLPAGAVPVEGGHFGANLVAYLLAQDHHAQVTAPLLLEQLGEYGIVLSAGQLHNLLTERKERFHQEKADVLAPGLAVSSYIGTDDTGARHQGHNGYCTAIGKDRFASFESSDRKSRLNFLHVLQGPPRA